MSGNQFALEDHYKTLGVSKSASDKEIKEAFYKLAKSISTPTKEQLIRYKPTARKTHNCRLFMKYASDKKEYQISALNATSFLTAI